jgi:hypothetical protein
MCPVEGALFRAESRTEMTRQRVNIRISIAIEKLRRLLKMRCFTIFCWLVNILNSHKTKTPYAIKFPCPVFTWLRITILDVPFIGYKTMILHAENGDILVIRTPTFIVFQWHNPSGRTVAPGGRLSL